KFASERNIGRLAGSTSMDKKVFRFIALVFAVFFLVIAAAGPQWGKELQELNRQGVDIMIALDTSRSMLAQDIQPSRLMKAKREITGFLERLKGDRVGLIFFSGTSFVQSPLTLDYAALTMFLELAGPDVIPVPGTDIAGAIIQAVDAFKTSGKNSKVLVLMTDGETHTENTREAVAKAAEKGIIIYTIGFGRGQGVPIPLRDDRGNVTGYKRDEDGKPVLSSLNSQILMEIANDTGGEFLPATSEESELDRIADYIDQMEKTKFKAFKGTKYKDRYQYPLAAALFFLVIFMFLDDRKKGF
ncbi:MAG: VWA domain-containing protein, partial [Acidobacteria bacterium]|nr:VWA domain-containing protein [Acidobacteriota bacterium]